QIIFLIIIYVSFISLGFGSSLIGVAWPSIQAEMGLPVSYGGYISTIRTLAVIVVCYLLSKLVSRFGIGKVGLYACIIMTVAWLGFALAPSYIWLLLSAIPLGLGAGALDSALNDFMAQNYSSRYLNWLHSFWGLGAVIGPLIMSGTVAKPGGWRTAFFIITGIEAFISILLVFALPMWNKVIHKEKNINNNDRKLQDDFPLDYSHLHPLKMPGMVWSAACFFLYTGVETCIAMWSATWLVIIRGLNDAEASGLVSTYFLGIMFARMISGVVSVRVTNKQLLTFGQFLLIIGAFLLFLPIPAAVPLLVMGIASGPIMPTMIHESPRRFGPIGKSNPVGFQMGTGFVGSTLLAPIFGKICAVLGFNWYPILILILSLILLFSNGMLNRSIKNIQTA
ncbi:MAG: MFS transporter, partial [Clostridiaceae bacterium]|nr:MFS transporter [Clostridiaceae bacterium]